MRKERNRISVKKKLIERMIRNYVKGGVKEDGEKGKEKKKQVREKGEKGKEKEKCKRNLDTWQNAEEREAA